jgi:serine phosphatase RsbU (regulator of sigma subunit)
VTSQPEQPARGKSMLGGRPFDRTTTIGIAALSAAVIILVILIGLITLLPAQTITQTLGTQASQQQRVLAGSLARQLENHLNNIAYDLIGLSTRLEIQSTAKTFLPAALNLLSDVAATRPGQIKSIVRLSADGTPYYAWPDSFDEKLVSGQALPWTVDKPWIEGVVARHVVRFTQQPLKDGGATYLLVTPINVGTNTTEALVIEVDMDYFFRNDFRVLDLGQTGQMWVFDQFGSELFHYREEPAFRGDFNQLPKDTQAVTLNNFPTADREAVVVPVSAFSNDRNQDRSMTMVLSRSINEGQEQIVSTLRSLFLFGLAIIGFIVLFGILIGRFLLRETNRRRTEEQRRSTARTLLVTSRALNSSLDLNIVLQRILGELGSIVPHDSASILLLSEDKKSVTVAAETGFSDTNDLPDKTALITGLRGAREVVATGRPVVINNCVTDPRWRLKEDSPIRSWLGVPLRVRDEPVGVLNIDSHIIDRFLPDDIDLAEAFADQAGVAIQNARSHELQIRVYEAELETARAIQTSLLPQELPPVPQVQLAARSIPARQVSGDYYQYYVLPDGKLGVAVGDVSGKGIPAALMMAVISTAMRDEIIRTPNPADLLNSLNERLLDRMRQNNMNSALMMSIFDPATRNVEIANGGMVQPYFRTSGGWDFVPVGGYPLGAAVRSDYRSKSVTLVPHSMLVMISDGVIESQNLKKEFFGFERLEALLADVPVECTSDDIADIIIRAVQAHLEGQEPQDDITVVAMKSMDN